MALSRKRFVKGSRFEFLALVVTAFFLSFIPLLNIPFSWIMTFFHEISHGIAAMVTGGSIESIRLYLTGRGLCTTSGGIHFFILQAGYIGAVVWGVLIYEMADIINHKRTSILAGCIAGLIGLVALLYGRDLMTWGILFVLFILFVNIIKLQEAYFMKLALKFIGLYVLLDAVRAPLYLVDGRHYGDGAKLADLTAIPEVIWVMLWLGFGVLGVYYLWWRTHFLEKE